MQETKKFTKEEIDEITKLKDKLNNVSMSLGQIRLQQLKLQEAEEKTIEEFDSVTNEEKQMARKLEAKYGQGTLDINTGEFIPSSE